MIIIIDTNILISALMKDSAARKIILYSGLNFFYPEMSLNEIEKHKNLILEKSGLSERQYRILLDKLFEYVSLMPTELLKGRLKEAEHVMLHIDKDDVVFIAAGLVYPNSIIWSDDSHFDRQNKIKVVKTRQFIEMIFRN
jgi:predicted nucleic acid-binding protein